MESQSEVENLKTAIQALDGQRSSLGDAVVEAALAPLREKLAALQAGVLGEQRKLVTVLFADLAGFTSLAARMDPEDVREIMNAYFERWVDCIRRQEGAVEKYIGDAVVAVFGLPVSHEDDAERAIRAALDMQKELRLFNQQLERERGLRLSMRVGINTGEVVVSLSGERQGEDFVLVGNMVNLASRLQNAAPVDGILITHDTYRHVRGLFETSPFGPLQLKGLDEPVQAYWVKAAKPRSFRLGSRGVEGVETPMVGRQAEFDWLKSAFQRLIEAKEHSLVTLVGEAGLGKSRLLFEFENWLELLPERAFYFKGRAHPSTQNLPYSLIRDMFAFRWEIQDSDSPGTVRQKLEAHAAGALGGGTEGQAKAHFIARLLGFEIGESEHLHGVEGDAKGLHDRAVIYLGEYFRAVGTAGTVVILLEDLHWADDSSLDLIGQLENLLAGQSFLVVCAARPALFERLPGWGEGLSFYTRLNLQPLDLEAGRALAGEILKKVDPLPPALLDLLVNTAEGNPFYLEELVKMLIDDGMIRKDGERWRVEEQRLGTLRVPPTLVGVLQARFDSLEPGQRSSLQRGAVIGRIFWEQAVAVLDAAQRAAHNAALDASPAARRESGNTDNTAEILDRLARREMIFRREHSSFENTTEYLFKHALLRDVTYASLLKRERRIYHGLAARWLEEATSRIGRSAEFALQIAGHYEEAGEGSQAAGWYRRAGREAAGRYANSEALHALSRALELSPEPDPRWKFDVLLEREKVYELLGRRDEQLADLDAMQSAAQESGDPAQVATAHLRRAQYAFQTADYSASLEHAQQAQELAERIQNLDLAAQSSLHQASTWMRRGDLDMAERLAQHALTLVAGQGLPGIEADIYRQLGLVAYYMGKHLQAREHFTEALRLYEQAGNRMGEAMAVNNLGGAAFELGEFTEAGKYYTLSLQLCRAIGDRTGEGRALNNLGIVAVTQGDYGQAEEYYGQALQIAREVGFRSFELSTLDNLGNLALYRYAFSLAEKYQLESLQGARAIGDRVTEVYVLINQARLYLTVGEYETAHSRVRESLDLARQLNDRQGDCEALIDLCQVLALTGDPQAALHTGEEALAMAEENGFRSEQGWAAHNLASTLSGLGRFAEAAGRYRQAFEIRQDLGETREAVDSLAGLARASLELGDLDGSRGSVETILAHLEEKGVYGFDEPGAIFLTCYRVLQALNDPRAAVVLRHGYALLHETASKIESEAMRRSYLERVAENRALIEAWKVEE